VSVSTASAPPSDNQREIARQQPGVDSDKWVVVTGFETEKKDNGDKICKPVVQLNLDSAPSCS
jgi:hypothetical protein